VGIGVITTEPIAIMAGIVIAAVGLLLRDKEGS